MRKHCSVYVRNCEEGPSCYYRVYQYLKEIDAKYRINNALSRRLFRLNLDHDMMVLKKLLQGYLYFLMLIKETLYLLWDIVSPPNCIIVQRTVLPRYTPRYINYLIKKIGRKSNIYWDFDDNILLDGEISKLHANTLFEYSSKIIVTSEFLRDQVPEKYRKKVIIMATTDGDFRELDINSIILERANSYLKQIELLWLGTSANLPYLRRIMPVLDSAAKILSDKTGKSMVLNIVSNKELDFNCSNLKINNIRWSREAVNIIIQSSHIGMMPLQHSEYTEGKGGFKLIQYISTAMPVIGSNVGYNPNVICNGCGFLVDDNVDIFAWEDKIVALASNIEFWKACSLNAYEHWKKNFSFDDNLSAWRDLVLDN